MLAALLLAVTAEAVTADGLIAQVVARAQETAKMRYERGLTGTKREQSYNMEKKPEKLETDKEFRLTMAPGGLLHQMVRISGIAVSDQPVEPPEIDPTVLIVTLHEKYDFRMAAPEKVNGCYSVAFDPKKPDPKKPLPPPKNSKEAVINHLSGVICIDGDAEHRYVREFQAWLEKKFGIDGVGKVHEASAVLEQVLVGDMPMPKRSVFSVRYSVAILWGTHTKTTVTYEYDPLPVTEAPLP